jgi:hypothetical protein
MRMEAYGGVRGGKGPYSHRNCSPVPLLRRGPRYTVVAALHATIIGDTSFFELAIIKAPCSNVRIEGSSGLWILGGVRLWHHRVGPCSPLWIRPGGDEAGRRWFVDQR